MVGKMGSFGLFGVVFKGRLIKMIAPEIKKIERGCELFSKKMECPIHKVLNKNTWSLFVMMGFFLTFSKIINKL